MTQNLVHCDICKKHTEIQQTIVNVFKNSYQLRCGHYHFVLEDKNWKSFSSKITVPEVLDFHKTVKYRLDIAVFNLEYLLANYDNTVSFAAGLTGFLTQSKAALDSLGQEISLYYNLPRRYPDYVYSIDDLLKNRNSLTANNIQLAQKLNVLDSNWYGDFKRFRDSEAVHRERGSRALAAVTNSLSIKIDGNEIDETCLMLLVEISNFIEECYEMM